VRRRLLFVGSGVSKGAKIDVEKGRGCWGLGLGLGLGSQGRYGGVPVLGSRGALLRL